MMKKLLSLILTISIAFSANAQKQALKTLSGETPANIKHSSLEQLKQIPHPGSMALSKKLERLETDLKKIQVISNKNLQQIKFISIDSLLAKNRIRIPKAAITPDTNIIAQEIRATKFRLPDFDLSFGNKDSISQIERPTLRDAQSFFYAFTSEQTTHGVYSVPTQMLEKAKFGEIVVISPTTNPRKIFLQAKNFKSDYYHCHTLDLGDEKMAYFSDDSDFSNQFLRRPPTNEELESDLIFPLMIRFDYSGFSIYYEQDGITKYDYYQLIPN